MPNVYIVTNALNGKQYIGFTTGPVELRWEQHLKNAGNSRKGALYNAIRKYGTGVFQIQSLRQVQRADTAKRLEIFFIKQFKTLAPDGYNMTRGGDGVTGISYWVGRHHTEESKRKMSFIHKGHKQSPATRKKIGQTLLRHTVSEETRQKIGFAHRGKRLSEETKRKMRGRSVSIETKEKLSFAHRGQIAWNKGRIGLWHPSEMTKEKMRLAWTPELRKKMSLVKIGKSWGTHSEETKIRIRRAMMGNVHWSRRGTCEETKRKMSLAMKGRPLSLEHRKKIGLALTRYNRLAAAGEKRNPRSR